MVVHASARTTGELKYCNSLVDAITKMALTVYKREHEKLLSILTFTKYY